jgi:hypothetical protein
VQLRHDTYTTVADYKAAIWRHYQARDFDFMDGIIHARDRFVLCLGRFVDRAPYTNAYDWMKVYYKSTRTRTEDFLKTPDYFFRYDRGVTNVHPRSWLGRLFFGKFLTSAQFLRIAEKVPRLIPRERPDVIVDLFMPFSKLDDYLAWHGKELDFFPLWCVPYKRVRDYEWIASDLFEGVDDELFVDLAIYGMKQPPGRNVYKEIEDKLMTISALKTLISYNYYEEDAFWRVFNEPNYAAVKRRTDPENLFRDLYSKTCKAAQGIG